MRLLPLSVSALLCLLAAPAVAQTEPPLDHARTLRESEMVFIPYMGMNRGPVFYTQYVQVATDSTATVGGMRRLFVNLHPTAHTQDLYNGFITRHGITDARLLPLPSSGSCQPTQGILDLLSGMPASYKPKIVGGNYPLVCGLSIHFMPTDEALVRAHIAANPVITLRATVPLCTPTSALLSVPAINQALVTAGALQTTPGGGVSGNSWDVLFESSKLAQNNPSLFVTQDPQVGWEAYIRSFVLDLAAQTATMAPATATNPATICTPSPLVIHFG
ncbi:hypothetical protein MYSTI_02714 [Myxococcus stipitatus DSM 14675]|uniref:Lipoprotein n=1 Tax=Myxococcus stipitatus (strain DSM 14675 / JCM 12634 / Mx s8) TaxID=1278073 RepID=L7U8A5_MYXSD|nr:hypothetical protein [Myxococcus stipitatus]AGC44030.1 hypothetical protein MYSTI_02714 [Myxococcus stipitatus DSM 14675]